MRNILSTLCLLVMSLTTAFGQNGTHWSCDYTQYEHDMVIYLSVTENDNISRYSDKLEVAAFINGECRGVATTNTNGVFILRVWSNEAEGNVSFKVGVRNETLELDEADGTTTVPFAANAIVGTPSAPCKYEIGSYEEAEVRELVKQALCIPMSEWSFSSSARYIDGVYYYFDETNHLAQFAGFGTTYQSSEFTIPATINYDNQQYCVVSITQRYYSYSYQKNVEKVNLPKSLVEIGNNAFRNYTNLLEIEIPENVKSIGSYSFYNTSKLNKIKFGSLVPPTFDSPNINYRAKVYVPAESFHAYRTISYLEDHIIIGGDGVTVTIDNLMAGDLSRQVLLQADYLQEVNILTVKGGEMNNDDWNTIKTMSNLIQLDIHGMSDSSIPSNAFQNRWAIENVVLPANLTSIGNYAFNGSGIKEISIPNTVTTIGRYAFEDCDSLRSVVIPRSVESIPYECFYNCGNLEKVTLPDNLTTIESEAFSYCEKLKDCKLPSQLTSLGTYAFNACALETVVLPTQLTEIPNYAFYNNNIKELDIPGSVETIGQYAFAYNKELQTVTFHEGTKTIGKYAFTEASVTELEFPSTLTSIAYLGSMENLNTVKVNAISPLSVSEAPTTTSEVALYVPDFCMNTYKTASGWSDYEDILPLEVRPENIYTNGKLELNLPAEEVDNYSPNITLDWSSKYENGDYLHGELVVGNDLKVKSLDFRISPRAKYVSDDDEFYYYNYGYNYRSTTEFNPTPIMVYGTLDAEDVTIRLSNMTSTWQFISLPVDVAMKDIKADDEDTQWVIRSYSGANRASGNGSEWINLMEDDVLKAGQGYAMHCYLYGENMATFTLKASNATFDSQDKVLNLEEHVSTYANDRSWNLVGNPYPTYCKIDHFDFTSPVTIWNSSQNSYFAYSPQDDDYILSPGEAFFVQRTTQPSITINANGRLLNRWSDGSNYAKAKASVISNREVFNIGVIDSDKKADRTRVVINPATSSGYDATTDAAKFASMDAAQPMLCTFENGVRYAINERPLSTGIIPLSVYASTDNVSLKLISVKNTSKQVYIEDKQTGAIEQVGTEGVELSKLTSNMWNDNRFYLHITDGTATGVINIENVVNEDNSIYDLSGRKLSSASHKGVYIVNGKKVMK